MMPSHETVIPFSSHLLFLVPSLHEHDERRLLGDHLGRLRQLSQRLSSSEKKKNVMRVVCSESAGPYGS